MIIINSKQFFRRFILLCWLCGTGLLNGRGYYYFEAFNDDYGVNGQEEWSNEFWYGRDTLVIGSNDNNTQLITNSRLRITGACAEECDRDGTWKGQYVWNTNKYNPTAEAPVGWEIVRLWALCDTAYGTGATYWNTPNDSRHQASIGIALFRDDPADPINKVHHCNEPGDFPDIRTNEWQQLDAIFQYDELIVDRGTYFEQQISYYDGIETKLNDYCTAALRPDNTSTNVSNLTLWDYLLTGEQMATNTNTNPLGFRMVHDGTFISLYINPDPGDSNIYPCEWMLLTKKQVIWNTAVQFMIGSQEKDCVWRGPAIGNGAFDNVLIRSATTASTVYLDPESVYVQPEAQSVTLLISNTIAPFPTNAGINRIKLIKPAAMAWSNGLDDIINNLKLTTYYDGTAHQLSASWFTPGVFPGNNEVHISTNAADADELVLILGTQITNMTDPADETVSIKMNIIQNTEFAADYGFTAYVNAEQYDYMPSSAKDYYSTCGWQKCFTSNYFIQADFPAEAYAALEPNSIVQGGSVKLTYYVQATEKAGYEDIAHLAIAIPTNFDPGHISNFSSILLGTNEQVYISVGSLPAFPGTNFILVDYSVIKLNSPNGLDVISFDYHGSSSDPATGIDLLWPSYVDGTALDGMSAQTVTNINYPAQQITVNQGGFNSWDYYLIQAVNYAPVSMGISNNTAMAYFDIAADGQDTGMEAVNDITLYFDGNAPDVSGIIQVYRDAGDKTNFSSVIDAELAAQAFNNTAGTVNITVNDQNQSQNQLDPTRYWISVTVTNDTPAVYDDRLNIKISNINVSGPNSGTLVSSNFLETMADKTARIDTHIIYVNFFNEVFSSVPQGEFNKLDFRMEISNSDPDTTNYLSSICISNRGSAVSSDLGYLKIFQDNGNGSFSINEDDGVSAGELSTNKIFTVSIYPPLPLSGTDNKVFWGAFDVDQLATVGATVELVAVNDNCLTFFDYHNDHVDPLPQVAELQSYPLPASPFAAKIILAGEKPYDFWLQRVDRRTPEIALPGIEVPLLSFDISREGKIATNQEWINSILVTNLYSGTNYSGYLKVYTNNQFEVDFRNSTPVSSNFLINNSNNYIEIVFSNTNIITTEPDLTRYFITYRPLAFAAKAVNDFRVASLGCGGPDNGAITNAAMLFSEDNAYPLAHHSNLVTINFTPVITSNSIVTQGDSNVLAARISIIPADSDAGWQLDHLNFTLSGSSWNAADIKNGRIYLDNGGTAGSWDNSDTLLDTESFETDGSFSPGFDPPLFITNQKNLLLLLNIDPAAHTDNSFALTYNPGLQNGFKQIEIRAEGFLVQSNVICTATNIVQTGELSIAALTVESDVRNNIIYTADGNPASIKVDKDAEVIIFDILGLRLGKLPAAAINADGWAEWDGKLEGVYVPSGVYILGVKKGKQIIKYEQVVVEKNRR